MVDEVQDRLDKPAETQDKAQTSDNAGKEVDAGREKQADDYKSYVKNLKDGMPSGVSGTFEKPQWLIDAAKQVQAGDAVNKLQPGDGSKDGGKDTTKDGAKDA